MQHAHQQVAARAPQAAAEPGVSHRRRSYISSPEPQARIVRQFMALMGLGIAMGLANAYVILSFSHIEIRVLPEASELEATLAAIYMASLAMASFGVVLLMAVFYSHRIGGPVFKIVGALERIADGDLRGRVRLRDTDVLGDVAAAVNEAGVSLGRAMREIDEQMVALRGCPDLDATAREGVQRIDAVLQQFGGGPQDGKSVGETNGEVMTLTRVAHRRPTA